MTKSKTPAGPTPNELRLRGELDRLRRELGRLRKQAQADADTAAPPSEPETPPAATELEPEPAEAVATPEPVVAARPSIGVDGADSADGGEAGKLRQQVAELSAAKQRLSKLYFSQLEENRKRSQKLHQILENISEINSELDLGALLKRLAQTIRASLGFRVVLIRIREPGTQTLSACASAGIEPEAWETLEREDLEVEKFLSWLRDDFKVSQSYFISHNNAFSKMLPAGYTPEIGPREEWEWHPEDVLLVPLFNRTGELLAYFSVDDPEDRLVPSREVVELLEIFGHHAVVAIENARLYHQREQHSHELEEAGRLLHEMHQLKSNFVSTVSHELRTPLTAIRAYVDTLLASREGELTHSQIVHFLSIINEESQRLSRLIESVLDLNRFDSGTLRLTRQTVDLAAVLHETARLLAPVAQVGQVQLKVVVECADTRVDANRDQMRQLALHLGSNAVKFTPAGGSVTMLLSGDAREIGLQVTDTGIGIPTDALERIFERFYQVDSSLVRRYGGTGLGLAICKSIVEWHGGRIHAESDNGGSRFSVHLPRRSAPRVIIRPGARSSPSAEDTLRLAIEMVAEVMGARVVSLLCPEESGDLVIRAAMGLEDEVVRETRVPPGAGVAGWVAQNRRPVCVADGEGPVDVSASGRDLYRSHTFLSVPIEHGAELLGVINVTDPINGEPFGAEDCQLLMQLSQRVAIAWQQALEMEERQADVEDTANALRQVLRHLERGRRSAPDRVRLARAMARELKLEESEVGLISFAASVHDIGMRRLGEHVVDGGGTLTEKDRRAVERHPEIGAEMLQPLETVGAVREIVMSHHEHWDGTGYPRGLKGDQIPIGARILAVVDAYESMTVGRPHRSATSRDEALSEIEGLSGRQFDPKVVEIFPRALDAVERARGNDGAQFTTLSLGDSRR